MVNTFPAPPIRQKWNRFVVSITGERRSANIGSVTVKLTGADQVVAPRLSVALASTVKLPVVSRVELKLYGGLTTSPTFVEWRKNSTFLIAPSLSFAWAVNVILDHATKFVRS